MRLHYMPSILYFGMPMGLIGAGLNAQHLSELLDLHNDIASWLLFYGWLSLAIVGGHYIKNLLGGQRKNLQQEWQHPFTRSFFPAITLTLLLLILSLQPYFQRLEIDQAWLTSVYFVIVGLHFLLNIQLVNSWLFREDLQITHHKPTWFILLSGNFMVVIAGVQLVDLQALPGWYELLWLFFSMGLLLWLTFTVSLFYRLFFESPLQQNMRPSLFIFLAPPSLAVIASLMLTEDSIAISGVTSLAISESLSPLIWILYSFATLMLSLWITLGRFFYQCGLSMAGWAYVYPLAAYGLATQYMAMQLNSSLLTVASVFIFIMTLILASLLSTWLVKQAFNKVID